MGTPRYTNFGQKDSEILAKEKRVMSHKNKQKVIFFLFLLVLVSLVIAIGVLFGPRLVSCYGKRIMSDDSPPTAEGKSNDVSLQVIRSGEDQPVSRPTEDPHIFMENITTTSRSSFEKSPQEILKSAEIKTGEPETPRTKPEGNKTTHFEGKIVSNDVDSHFP